VEKSERTRWKSEVVPVTLSKAFETYEAYSSAPNYNVWNITAVVDPEGLEKQHFCGHQAM